MNGVHSPQIRLVWRSQAAVPPFSIHPVCAVIALAICGITLVGWPFIESQEEEINVWIGQHQNAIGVVLLCMIAAIARVVRKLSQRDERVQKPPRFGLSDFLYASSRSSEGSPPAA
jgi:hypothetical protein